MFNKLTRLLLALNLAVTAAAHEIVEVTHENPPNKALAGFQFAVINFYDDSDTSTEVKKIFQDAMNIFKGEEKLESRSVGWAQVDVKKNTDLAIAAQDITYPSQLIAAAGSMRKIKIQREEG